VIAVNTPPSPSLTRPPTHTGRAENQIEIWERGTAPYPSIIDGVEQQPNRLYALGDAGVLDRQAVAVVGARQATTYSLSFARRLGRTLADAGACVVSGLAIGVDAAAHRGALEVQGGRTCAVLGGGIEVGAPDTNRALRDDIAKRGLLLSEWAPDVRPEPWKFPHRNRLIAALARATVIVQASPQGGAMHTVRHADKLAREIGVVPGPVDTEAFRGSNSWLTHPGVTLVVEPEDVLGLLTSRKEVHASPPEFTDDEAKVWDVLADGSVDIDTIVVRSHLPTTRCLAAITALELAGTVECGVTGEVRRR
jgi:DNA processing protein